MAKRSIGDTLVRFLKALENLNPDDEESSNHIATYLYIPDSRISSYLKDLKEYKKLENPVAKQRRNAGDLLEKIAVLAFLGLRGLESVKSYCSAGPQYDLLVGGDDAPWLLLCKVLFMKGNQRDIVVEAKCTSSKVSDAQFARLCSIMEDNLPHTTGLGVFFTLNGASGFSERGAERQKQLRLAKMRQVIFHARTGKAIIVLDAEDIFLLNQPGLFITMLINKIREIEYLSGLSSLKPCELLEVDLPQHLAPLVDEFMNK